jgi:hypothetical protein
VAAWRHRTYRRQPCLRSQETALFLFQRDHPCGLWGIIPTR